MSLVMAEQLSFSGATDGRSRRVLASVHSLEQFEGEGVELLFDHMCITQMNLGPMQLTAGDDFSSADLVTVFFVIEGAFTVNDHRQCFRFMPGSAAFLSNRTSISVQSTRPTRLMSITVRRAVLERHGVRLRAEFGSFAYSTAQMTPVVQYVLDLVEVALQTPVQAQPVEANIVQLIIRLFAEDRAYDEV